MRIFLLALLSLAPRAFGFGKEVVKKEAPAAETKGEIVDAGGLDGCKFLVKMPNGKFLQPTNLDSGFEKTGLKVVLKYKERPDLSSICMRGAMVDVVSIEKQK